MTTPTPITPAPEEPKPFYAAGPVDVPGWSGTTVTNCIRDAGRVHLAVRVTTDGDVRLSDILPLTARLSPTEVAFGDVLASKPWYQPPRTVELFVLRAGKTVVAFSYEQPDFRVYGEGAVTLRLVTGVPIGLERLVNVFGGAPMNAEMRERLETLAATGKLPEPV